MAMAEAAGEALGAAEIREGGGNVCDIEGGGGDRWIWQI